MLLIIDMVDGCDLQMREDLYGFCAELCQRTLLDGCLIVFPTTVAGRAWVPPFINSLRSAGVRRVNLLIPTSCFSPDDIELIEGMGVYELILVEDTYDIHFINTPQIGVHVWLNGVDQGDNHKKICRWNSFVKNLLSVEKAPFTWLTNSDPRIFMWDDSPLPKHDFLKRWKTRLPLQAIGDNPGANAVVSIPEWLFTSDRLPQASSEDRQFFDFVTDDLTKMTDQKRQVLQKDFLERIRQNAEKISP